jgi:hypothetical protein
MVQQVVRAWLVLAAVEVASGLAVILFGVLRGRPRRS